jgi:ATP-dependent RNA helicase DeaD
VRYRLEVGRDHGVQPGNIVGAIANDAGVDSAHIGRIEIFDAYSTVELPEGMPKEIYKHLRNVWVSGHKLAISVDRASTGAASRPRRAR